MDNGGEVKLDVETWAGLNKKGIIEVGAGIYGEEVARHRIDLGQLLKAQVGYHLCYKPLRFRTKKDRREVEVLFNDFERAAKRALRVGRKELRRYKAGRNG